MDDKANIGGRFVVQKHDATNLHYDFRLEAEGMLKSWAVPKGPSLDPSKRRLAVQVEDHDLDYFDFEGVISSGYGAGTVLVWDWGEYENLTERHGRRVSVGDALKTGKLSFRLHGEKLKGEFTLVRMKKSQNWLLMKKGDDEAQFDVDPTSLAPWSVKTGRLLDEIEVDDSDVD